MSFRYITQKNRRFVALERGNIRLRISVGKFTTMVQENIVSSRADMQKMYPYMSICIKCSNQHCEIYFHQLNANISFVSPT